MKLPQWLAARGVKRIIGLDFETYYDADYTLRKMSTTSYVRDKQFKAHCVGLQQHDEKKARWFKDRDVVKALRRIDWSTTAVLCHHTHFDGLILTHHYGHVPAFYLCTLSMARPLHGGEIDNDLETLSRYYGGRGKVKGYLDECKGVRDLYSRTNEAIGNKLGEGCARDVEEMWRVFERMYDKYPLDELLLIHHTVRAYTEPVLKVDVPLARIAHTKEVERKQAILDKIGEDPKTLRSREKFANLLRDEGVTPPTKVSPRTGEETYAFAKADLEFQALSEHKSERVRLLVEARQIVQSSLAETRPLRLIQHSKPALPVYLNYGKAHTLRWSGGDKVNLQNLSKAGDLRACIKAPPGYTLVIGDSAQIEARTVAWLAGETELVEAFRNGDDIYSQFAEENVYGYPVTKATHPLERTVGKVCVLGLGFQMWVDKFRYSLNAGIMTGGVGIYLDDESLYKKAVVGYRNRFKKIVALWDTMDRAITAMYLGTETKIGPLTTSKGSIELPNGMKLLYPELRPASTKVIKQTKENALFKKKKGDEAEQVQYSDWTYNNGMKIYGGLFTENVVQSLARLVVAQQALTIADDYRIVLLVHDEIVLCVRKAQATKAEKALAKALSTAPDWCSDLPVACETMVTERYTK